MDFNNLINLLKKHKYFIVFLFLSGFFYIQNIDAYHMFMWDESEYASLGRSLLTNQEYTLNDQSHALRPPMLPMINAVSFFIFGINDISTKIPLVLFALLSFVVIYVVIRREFDEKIAMTSSFFLSITPLYLKHLGHNLAEIPFIFFYLVSIFMFYYALKINKKYFYPAWIFFGLALMARYNGLLILVSVGIYGFYLFIKQKNKKQYISNLFLSKSFILAPLIALIVVSPWYIYQYLAFGTPFKGLIISSGQLTSWAKLVGGAPDYIYFLWLPNLVSFLILLLSVIGITYMIVKRNSFLGYLMLNLMIVFVYFSAQPSKDPRFMTQLMPIFAIFAAIGLFKVIYPWLCRDINKKFVFFVLIISVAYVGFVNYSDAQINYERSSALGYPSMIQASSFVKASTNYTQSIVGASTPQYYWYSERVTYGYPREEQKLFEYLDEKNSSYLLINNHERLQPQYVIQFFAKGFFDSQGALKYPEDALKIKIFGDLAHFNDASRYPVTIVVPADLFVLRTKDLLDGIN